MEDSSPGTNAAAVGFQTNLKFSLGTVRIAVTICRKYSSTRRRGWWRSRCTNRRRAPTRASDRHPLCRADQVLANASKSLL